MYDQTDMNQSSFMNEILTPKLENISVLSVAVNNDSIKKDCSGLKIDLFCA